MPKLFNYLQDNEDNKDNKYEGEWELVEGDEYELYFYKYIPEKKAMYITKGDQGNSTRLLYKDIQETFIDFKYSYSFCKEEELSEEEYTK